MTYILRDQNGLIQSFGVTSFIVDPETGCSMDYTDVSFYDYARRFMLSFNGVSGQTIQVYQSGPDVDIDVNVTTGVTSVDLDINGVIENVQLESGKGKIKLSTAHPGLFIISPADRKMYCSAGNGLMVVEVMPNA